ncbi:DUF397 domain-containing protein [Streptomyces sp. NPDC001478]
MTSGPPHWRKSSYSSNGGECVEVATDFAATSGTVPVRDSKQADGPIMTISTNAFSSFIAGVGSSEFSAIYWSAMYGDPAQVHPRARGGGPAPAKVTVPPAACSPHTQGWSGEELRGERHGLALPARAVAAPGVASPPNSPQTAPRAGGDGPAQPSWREAHKTCAFRPGGVHPGPSSEQEHRDGGVATHGGRGGAKKWDV